MAETEHVAQLDAFDRLSVCLYRLGITVFSVALIALSVWYLLPLSSYTPSTGSQYWLLIFLMIGSALSAANVHVYNKYVRAVIAWASWIGLVLFCTDMELQRVWLSLGFFCVTFSGIALKESFCFKVLGLKLVPLLLAMSIGLLALNLSFYAAVIFFFSGIILMYLSIKKWRMPLHFDIGNKANYQI